MKIAIHHRPGSFSDRWIEYCKENNICYKIVNAYDTDIIQQVSDCTAFMWHHTQCDYRDKLFAKQLIYSLEAKGLKVFPDFYTTWHFDDKVGQKYLLEAVGAPLVPSYVFYDKKEAIEWVNQTTFPKVFKLRGGAGSANVQLVPTKKDAIRLVNRAFGKGFPQFNRRGNLKERIRKYKEGKDTLWGVCKGMGRLFIPTELAKIVGPEKGYVYFQDFIPNNKYDIRLIVIGGEKAYGLKRIVRKNDFRASGSKKFVYDQINNETIIKAFDIANKLKLQSVAFDFIYSNKGKPLIVEMSYGYGTEGSGKCKGYWDKDLNWHEGPFDPYGWMVELVK